MAEGPVITLVCGTRNALCAVRLPPGIASVVVQRVACPLAGADCTCHPAIAVIEGGSDAGARLETVLADYGACVEDAASCVLVGANLETALASKGLYMTLTTATAYSAEPARHFCSVLAQRLGLAEERRLDLELALHEAIVNGLLHGNLEISSDGRDTLAGLAAYCDSIATHLQDPRFATRPLEVFATWDDAVISLVVLDCGPGYEPAAVVSADDPNRKSGRGLQLIRQIADEVEIGERGRRMTMRFAR